MNRPSGNSPFDLVHSGYSVYAYSDINNKIRKN